MPNFYGHFISSAFEIFENTVLLLSSVVLSLNLVHYLD